MLACGDVAVNAAVTSAMVTRWQGPTKEGRGSDRPSVIWRVPTSAIVLAFDALDRRTNKDVRSASKDDQGIRHHWLRPLGYAGDLSDRAARLPACEISHSHWEPSHPILALW
ncbi:hypothetical protein Psi02_64190 [Planotetraspora silvatica]|uniref:Uncharacterized protein n=1 Tax=Planotetraspora silvatica TaxID=234614 RepID=A0A8J3V4T8_9ACTN|nr:hypothetical protein Psi02_64190 [Planotetraspora silvatica]